MRSWSARRALRLFLNKEKKQLDARSKELASDVTQGLGGPLVREYAVEWKDDRVSEFYREVYREQEFERPVGRRRHATEVRYRSTVAVRQFIFSLKSPKLPQTRRDAPGGYLDMPYVS